MAKRYDICTPRKKSDGGTYWVKIGSAWEGDKGIQLVFDALPIPDAEGRCAANLFEPRSRDEQHSARLNRGEPNNRFPTDGPDYSDLDDDIKF